MLMKHFSPLVQHELSVSQSNEDSRANDAIKDTNGKSVSYNNDSNPCNAQKFLGLSFVLKQK